MTYVLLAAGVYNILWGAFAVLFPNTLFDWLGMARPNYPEFWQCIGMIVGVYGVGYAIAAFDPARHWPIVLVGLMGKIFGPLGMVQALWLGTLPWAFALNCVTNDLIWWIPFALILRHAWRVHFHEPDAGSIPDALAATRTSEGTPLTDLARGRRVLLVFLRHSGCTFCRETLADLAAAKPGLDALGVEPVLIHMSHPETFRDFATRYGLEDVEAVSDPERRLYRAFGLQRGSFAALFGPEVLRRGIRAFRNGHGIGLLDGDGLQMPGAFVLDDGAVRARFVHRSAADRPDYLTLAREHLA